MSPISVSIALVRFLTIPGSEHCASTRGRIEESFVAYERRIFARTNQLFWWLLVAQWSFAVVVAAIWSPRAWAGEESTLHPHLIAAVLLGAVLTLPPLLLIRWMPYHWLARHMVAVAQVSFSALLIHLTGGRIETHFHVFGSLAFLALYRDWRVLVTATLVVALDHLLRGIWFPVSVYGVPYATAWRTVEHAGWVIFEDVVLAWACAMSRREMWEICRREDQNRQLLGELEQRVRDRTAALEAEVRGHERTATDLRTSEERYRTLVENAPIGIFKTTRTGEVRFANPYLRRLLGIPLHVELSQLNMADGRMVAHEARERLWTRLETEFEVRGFESTCTKTDGAKIEVVVNARLTTSDAGGPLVCEGTVEDVTAQKRAQRDLEVVHQQLVVASRQAGMADVATGVLHNVGNVLTSVNVTTQDLLDRLRTSRIGLLQRVVDTFERERPRLAAFLTEDPTGQRLPEFLAKLAAHLSEENTHMRADVESLVRHFVHIRQVIVTQQNAARVFGVTENLAPEQLFEDALKLNAESLGRHGIALVREFGTAPFVKADRHKVLQILVNLIKNAKDAVLECGRPDPSIAVRVRGHRAGKPRAHFFARLHHEAHRPRLRPAQLRTRGPRHAGRSYRGERWTGLRRDVHAPASCRDEMNTPGPANRRILVIDDNLSIHNDFARILVPRQGGNAELDAEAAWLLGDSPAVPSAPAAPACEFTLAFAAQGQEGLAKVKAARAAGEPFALAFVDMRMPPGWDGLTTIGKLWEVDPQLQVVICTAHCDRTWDEIAATLTARDRWAVLKKPFEKIEVLQLVHVLTRKWDLAHAVGPALHPVS